MKTTTLAFLSVLAIGAVALPAHASDWTAQGNPAHPGEAGPGPAVNPVVGGGWAVVPTGEQGGGFDARYATPIYGGGQPVTVTAEAAGSFSRATAVRLGAPGEAQRALAALIAAERG
ncbi:hypothetical protein [Elioraea tepidiphila]|jgi:hypothetical protein|uniref:hypothetical protein n=1 Tax=Elioraea tepidiphila TaxID=457934 RepID=UPI002FD9D2EB